MLASAAPFALPSDPPAPPAPFAGDDDMLLVEDIDAEPAAPRTAELLWPVLVGALALPLGAADGALLPAIEVTGSGTLGVLLHATNKPAVINSRFIFASLHAEG